MWDFMQKKYFILRFFRIIVKPERGREKERKKEGEIKKKLFSCGKKPVSCKEGSTFGRQTRIIIMEVNKIYYTIRLLQYLHNH